GTLAARMPKATLSYTLSESKSAAPWNRKPTRSRSFASSRSPRSVSDLPSKSTWPSVARRSPTISFSATVFPQPLSPMIASVLPRSNLKLMSRKIVCGPKRMPTRSNSTNTEPASAIRPPLPAHHRPDARPLLADAVQHQCQQEVRDEDRDERQHERLSRRSANALGTGPAAEAAMAGDQRNQRPKNDWLRHPRDDVEHLHEVASVSPVVVRVDAVDFDDNQLGPEHAPE